MNTVAQILAKVRESDFQDKLGAEVWLSFVLDKEKIFLFLNPDFEVSEEIEQKFWMGIEEMTKGRPLAQLTGRREFYGLEFLVDENVLIPRPESELLVYLAKDFIRKKAKSHPVSVADIGTGSGCIMLSLLKDCLEIKGVAVEISAEALEVAQENARILKVEDRVEFRKGDLLMPIRERIDVILANLPYIGRQRFNFIADNVAKYEPEVALYGGVDGLDLYRKMFAQLHSKGWYPDFMAGEFGFGQAEEMQKILHENFAGKGDFEIIPDLAGIPRVFVVNFA